MMSGLVGTSKLLIRPVANKDWCIWRMNEEKLSYPLFTVPEKDEAVEVGRKLAKILELPCEIRDKKCEGCNVYVTTLSPFLNGKEEVQLCPRCINVLKKK